ncbi:MAG: hypothetical protein JWN95_1972 [Frankiales bacterium]|nr:hypothetical protein [Frankiales bacterium]
MSDDHRKPTEPATPPAAQRSVRFVTDGGSGGEAAALIAGIADDEGDAGVAELEVRPGSKGWNHTA